MFENQPKNKAPPPKSLCLPSLTLVFNVSKLYRKQSSKFKTMFSFPRAPIPRQCKPINKTTNLYNILRCDWNNLRHSSHRSLCRHDLNAAPSHSTAPPQFTRHHSRSETGGLELLSSFIHGSRARAQNRALNRASRHHLSHCRQNTKPGERETEKIANEGGEGEDLVKISGK